MVVINYLLINCTIITYITDLFYNKLKNPENCLLLNQSWYMHTSPYDKYICMQTKSPSGQWLYSLYVSKE